MKRLLIIALLLMASPALGSTWYVRPVTGEYGAENGTAYATAYDGWAGITWGAGGVVAGDTLYVCGTFTGEYANIGAAGSVGLPITIDGNCNAGADPGILDGNASSVHALRCSGQAYITIQNLTVRNGTSDDIGTVSACDNMIIDNVTSDSGVNGFQIASANLIIRNTTVSGHTNSGAVITASNNAYIHDSTFHTNGTAGANNHDQLFIGNASTGFLVQNCKAYGGPGTTGAGFDASDGSGTFSGCQSYNNSGNGFGASGAATDTVVYTGCSAFGNLANWVIYEDVVATIGSSFMGSASYTALVMDAVHVTAPRVVNMTGTIISGAYPRAIRILTTSTTLTSNSNIICGGITTFATVDTVSKTFAEWVALGWDSASKNCGSILFGVSGSGFKVQ